MVMAAESTDLGERFAEAVLLLLLFFADQHFSRSSGFSCKQRKEDKLVSQFWVGKSGEEEEEKSRKQHKKKSTKQSLIWWLN